jgi:UDP-glucose 4-epimerase
MVSLKTNAGKGHLTHGNLADRLNQIQSDLPRLKGLIRASLIKLASKAALGFCDKLQVYGTNYHTPDGTCLRDYIQVTDLVRAHQNSLEYLRAGGESIICNCGYSRGFSVFEVIESVKRVSGKEFRVDICPRRSGDPASLIASNDRIKNIMGWKPQYEDLDLIVKQALEWEMKLAIKNQLGREASNRI